MFRTVLTSIIRSSWLYVQQQAYVKQILLYVKSWTPDDGWKDRPKHVKLFQNKFETLVRLVGFTIEICYYSRPYERQNWYVVTDVSGQPIGTLFKVQAVQ